MIPYKQKAVKLMQDGARALAVVESNGIRIDTEYLDKTIRKTEKKIIRLEKNLWKSDVSKVWKKHFGLKTNFGSGEQLGIILFDKMGYECPELTPSGKFKTDEGSLASVDHPFVKDLLEVKKLQKANTTYLKGIKREVVDGLLHPFFNLHTTQTFRSSSDSPNFQNIPVRDPVMGKLIRTAFIGRTGNHLVELDYSGIEVSIAACYHKDPVMLEYLFDKSKDMHRDMAMECFMLSKEEMTNPVDEADGKRMKLIRYFGKNQFVFPQFYGDFYASCAKSLWDSAIQNKLTLRDGTLIIDHLASKGITELGDLDPREKPRRGTFEKHLQEVENDFWNKRFSVYGKWKKDEIKKYYKKGYLLSKTGFICRGAMKRNEIVNYPVQGSAFHCLLQSLTWIVNGELKKAKMKALIVGQIHDSIVADVPEEELAEFLILCRRVMTKRLTDAWKWINVPLEIEAEVCPLGGSWSDKKEMVIG